MISTLPVIWLAQHVVVTNSCDDHEIISNTDKMFFIFIRCSCHHELVHAKINIITCYRQPLGDLPLWPCE